MLRTPRALAPGRALETRPRRRLPPLMLVAAVLGALWFGVFDKGQSAAPPNTRLPVPVAGSRTLPVSLVLILAIDESGSTDESDPNRLRHRAAETLVTWLARYSENANDRLSVVRFAASASASQLLPAREAAHVVPSELAAPTAGLDLSGTSITPVVDTVEQQLANYTAERRVVVLVTDGQFSEDEPAVRDAMRRLRGSADSVYLVALDGDGAWEGGIDTVFDQLGLDEIIPLRRLGEGDFVQAIGGIVLRETGLEVRQ